MKENNKSYINDYNYKYNDYNHIDDKDEYADLYILKDDSKYGIENDARYYYPPHIQDKTLYQPSLLEDDVELINMFKDGNISKARELHIEMMKLKSQDEYEKLKQKKKTFNKIIEFIKDKYDNDHFADLILRQLKRGRIKYSQLSDLLFLNEIQSLGFTKKLRNYIRDNNLTIVAYRRKEQGPHYCVGVNGDDININLDVLRYIIKNIYDNDHYKIHIKNYSHGTWADMKDLIRSSHYNNRQEYDYDYNPKYVKKEGFHSFKKEYNAWVNSSYLNIDYNNKNKADIYIYNSNYPRNSFFDVPTVYGMSDRGYKSSNVFNAVLQVINDESQIQRQLGKSKGFSLDKKIIISGVSNGIVNMLKGCQYIENNNLDDDTLIHMDMESIPQYKPFTASSPEMAQFFVSAVLNNEQLFNRIGEIKIETNLSKKYHPYEAVYGFLECVYKYFIYDDNVSFDQMQKFHDKLSIATPALKQQCEKIYHDAIKKKDRWSRLSEEEKIKKTQLEGAIMFVYILLCLTIIGAFLLYPMKKWQKHSNDKRYLNKINIPDIKEQSQDELIYSNTNKPIINDINYSNNIQEDSLQLINYK